MARWRGRGGDGEHMAPLAPVPARRDNTCSWRAASVAFLCLLAASMIIVGVLHSSSATAWSTATSPVSSAEYSLRGLNEANDTDGGAITDGPIANVSEYLRSIGYDADAEDGGNVFITKWYVRSEPNPNALREAPSMCLRNSTWHRSFADILMVIDADVDNVAATFNNRPFSRLLGVSITFDDYCQPFLASRAEATSRAYVKAWMSCPADTSLLLNASGHPFDALPPPPTGFNRTLPERWEAVGPRIKACGATLHFRDGRDPLLSARHDTTHFAHFRWWSNTHWCRDSRVVGFYFMQAIKPGTTCTDGYANYPAF